MNLYICTRRRGVRVRAHVVYATRLLLTETYHVTKTASYKAERISSNVTSGSVI